jgi:hypothetical protein
LAVCFQHRAENFAKTAAPVSALYVFGRSQDAALQRARSSINERNHLRIWLTPLRFEGKPVWIAGD